MCSRRPVWAEEDFAPPAGSIRLQGDSPLEGEKKYIMYHGTTSMAAQSIQRSGFKQSEDGMLGPGVYLSRDVDKASRYPLKHPEEDRRVIRALVNVGKVAVINRQGHPLQKTWHYNGYNSAWVPPGCGMVPSGLEENCVYDPKRIQVLKIIQPQM